MSSIRLLLFNRDRYYNNNIPHCSDSRLFYPSGLLNIYGIVQSHIVILFVVV
ncbi:hypothetical protein [Calothrix rhizosoleniae]|uniref:hypothetical protein n=1 Tax=Calothrix rhizosoleniae TaxID=888997 RepID=UPI0013564127|nr:hypothetical protein [Calothrix rhizosoleniae]